ncbi:MAG: putative baseplate assembly protein [Rhodospirillales bacterium]|nr:MAG: putative baseplate assembly protein [Rhodospirillales bacterium]
MNGSDTPLVVGDALSGTVVDDCGCCAGTAVETPQAVRNRPGLSAVAYRVATHGSFKATMLARLSSAAHPALDRLRTRDDDDFSIALLDAWATVADVLTFYQERLINEAWLRTATERFSILELARLIGYRPRPGVAASTWLAFTMEDAPGAPDQAVAATLVARGTAVKSIPGPGELPQTFETMEDIEARVAWNALRPRQTIPHPPEAGGRKVYLHGTGHTLKPGDMLLFVGDERLADSASPRWDFRRIQTVTEAADATWTLVTWDAQLATVPPRTQFPAAPLVYVFRERASVYGYNAPAWRILAASTRASYLGVPESDLPTVDPGEWPDFTIFAPLFPLQPKYVSGVDDLLFATVEEVAMAATSAAQASSTLAMHEASAATAGLANAAAELGRSGVEVATKTAAALESVARTTADATIAQAHAIVRSHVAGLNTLIEGPLATVETTVKQAVIGRIESLGTSLDQIVGPLLAGLPEDQAPADLLDAVKSAVRTKVTEAIEEVRAELVQMVPDATAIFNQAIDAARAAVDTVPDLDFSGLAGDLANSRNPLAVLGKAGDQALNAAKGAVANLSLDDTALPDGYEDRSPTQVVEDMIAGMTDALGSVDLSGLPTPQSIMNAAKDAVDASAEIAGTVERIKQSVIMSGGLALAQVGEGIAATMDQVRSAALAAARAVNPENVMAELGQRATAFASRAETATNSALDAAGAAISAAVVSAAVQIAKEAPAPLPEPTPEFVALVARFFADFMIAKLGGLPPPAAETHSAAMAQIQAKVEAMVPLAMPAAVGATGEMYLAASSGATKVRTALVAATDKALMAKVIAAKPIFDGYKRSSDSIDLDRVYPNVMKDGWVMLSTPTTQELYRVTKAVEGARDEYHLSGKTTRITLAGPNLATFDPAVRETVVFAGSDILPVTEAPFEWPVFGDTVALAHEVEELEAGRLMIIRGRCAKLTAATGVTLVAEAEGGGTRSVDKGQTLTLVTEPKAITGSATQKLWRLIDEDGFAGTVTTAENAFVARSADEDDAVLAEVAVLDRVEAVEPGYSRIVFKAPLEHAYDRASTEILANVVPATHGEAAADVLGSGDAGQPFQQFALRQKPLTHVSATTPSGTESSLDIRVNDVLWQEVPHLFGRSPKDRIYATRTDDDGVTSVQFGDGVTGARLPTGQDNIRASYRKGVGRDGNVRAGSLEMLMARPLGVKEATNPLPATGGDDPEPREQARTNAPVTVLTLERTVSLRDYEDFARSFAGIAKALATWSWDGDTRRVFVTVAGPDGATVEAGSALHDNLQKALKQAGDPFVAVAAGSYRPATFRLGFRVKVAPDRTPAVVLAAVEAAVRAGFAFDARSFGQPVTSSEVIATVHAVAGVAAVTLTTLRRSTPPGAGAGVHRRLLAALPEVAADGSMSAAELLTLDPEPLETLEEMA